MRAKLLSLVLSSLIGVSSVSAHSGHSHQTSTSAFTTSTGSKFAMNSEAGHLGHFFLRRVKTKKNKEVLFIKQTFHFEEDFTKRTKARYNKNTGLLTYDFTVPSENQRYFMYINLDSLDGIANDGYRVIIDTENGNVSSEEITLTVEAPESHTHN